MLVRRTRNMGSVGRSELAQRVEDFDAGRWSDLLTEGRRQVVRCDEPQCKGDGRELAEEQLPRAEWQGAKSQEPDTGASLAPKNEDTLTELRSKRPQEVQSSFPQHALDSVPECVLKLDAKVFAYCFRSVPCGSSPGPGGCTYEMVKVCLNDSDTLQLLTVAAEDFARAGIKQG